MWVTKLLSSPVKKMIFCPKTTKLSPKLAFLSIAGSFGALLAGWLVVLARAVSRKTPTYILYSPYASASVGVSAGVIGTIEGCESSYAHGPRRHPLSVRHCLSLHKDSQSLL